MDRLRFLFQLSVLLLLLVSNAAFAQGPCDQQATRETVQLYHRLKERSAKGYLVGHQDDLAYGVGWKYEAGRSDIKDVTGDYPALYGWDIANIEQDDKTANIDGVPFKKMRSFIREGYERGGVISITWHVNSPGVPGANAWDTTHGTVTAVLPGGVHHAMYKEWLDKVAAFMLSLKGVKGELIPVLFRPYHELSGNWFWWCRNTCTPAEFITLWRFTIHYLQQEKQVHNLLYVFNTAGNFKNSTEFLERYPGDDMADVLSFDAYQYDDPQKSDHFIRETDTQLGILDSLAITKHKITALAETGYEQIPYAQWWTKTLAPAIGNHRIAWVLLWRNHGYNESMKRMHYYMPYKGQVSAPDFIEFYKQPQTLFGKDVFEESMYAPQH
ncbi:glycoside hydrolase family 26 protein [Chitinophaga sp.]|uniref:glycoside hydrolase family 26 protein n=1 Tax=Chitinophaga sp. TaxID=1869181 RepID=UPI002F93A6FD